MPYWALRDDEFSDGQGIKNSLEKDCGWERRGKVSRISFSCSHGNHRLLPNPVVSQVGVVHLLDMVLTGPEPGHAWGRGGRR